MPIDYSKYPADWKQIRARILERAKHRCEWCRVPNLERGSRNSFDEWWNEEKQLAYFECYGELPPEFDDTKVIKIVLTVAHLDHDVTNNADSNLVALCQRCHLRYDAKHHANNAKATRDRKRGQADMLADSAQEGGAR